ncbi:hypothetical protein L596_006108 [Steinernema carpocapsae]|uniref:Uncharacterized protein n=1 Tax=Steinernema carpocapsae TaxID=34508 RepID=A0A4U8V143_STECR|nr:hypothetical protein L596_006108 [Steinernema carpocapsae]
MINARVRALKRSASEREAESGEGARMETIPEEDHEKLSVSGSQQCLTATSFSAVSGNQSTRTIESKSRLKEIYTSEQVDTLVT